MLGYVEYSNLPPNNDNEELYLNVYGSDDENTKVQANKRTTQPSAKQDCCHKEQCHLPKKKKRRNHKKKKKCFANDKGPRTEDQDQKWHDLEEWLARGAHLTKKQAQQSGSPNPNLDPNPNANPNIDLNTNPPNQIC
jgi:hypothetical protein